MPQRPSRIALVMGLTLAVVAGTAGAEERIELRSVTYQAGMSRDPFRLPDYTVEGVKNTEELNLVTATLVGVVKLPDGYIALVEDENGESYALQEGDPVWRGRIQAVREGSLTAWVRSADMNQRVRLELVKEGE